MSNAALAALDKQSLKAAAEKVAAKENPAAAAMKAVMPEPPKLRKPEFSVVTCSVQDDRFKAMANSYTQLALAGEDYEIIRISDAKSLAEGYQRGAAKAVGEIVIFSHDDAAPLRPIGAKLRNHLRRCDIVAGAGSDRLDGPAWFTAGHPHVFGQVLNKLPPARFIPDICEKIVAARPFEKIEDIARVGLDPQIVAAFKPAIEQRGGLAFVNQANAADIGQLAVEQPLNLTIYGVPSALVEGIQVFDGFWFAARRDVLAREIGSGCTVRGEIDFDPQMCDGFHMYDVDFSYRAYRRGLRIGVGCDLCLLHASIGGYDDPKWKPAAEKWMGAHGDRLPSHKARAFQFACVSGADPADMITVMEGLVERTR